jgi:fibronectin type 3 domain-containing protein
MLNWSASPAATGYKVYMGTAPGQQSVVPVQTVTGTTAVVTGLTGARFYYFYVQADTLLGSSNPSTEVSAAPLAPPAPSNLTAVAGQNQITLTWSASSGATTYNVYMGTSAAGIASAPVQTGISGLSTVVASLTAGTNYFFVVRAETPNGLSLISNTASASPTPPPPPPAPSNLGASAGQNQITLTWAAAAGATSYSVYSGTSAGGQSANAIQSGISGLSTIVSSLNAGTTYYFVVRAESSNGFSAPSNEVSATPTAPPPAVNNSGGGGGGGGGAIGAISLLVLLLLACQGPFVSRTGLRVSRRMRE